MKKDDKIIKIVKEDKEKIEQLENLLGIILKLHFANAMTYMLLDKELFEKTFARLQDKEIIKALSIFANKINFKEAEKILNNVNPYDLLHISNKEKERYENTCKTHKK